jgi:hypothetical protein
MDTFAEQLVKKNLSGNENLKRIMTLSGSVILAGIIIAVSASIFSYYILAGIVIGIVIITGGFFLARNYDIEYEYSITNGELDIDKIIAKQKRKPFISVNVSDFTAYGKYSDDTTEADESTTFILACDGTEKGYWYADFNAGKYGKSRLIFSPNEKIRSCIKPYLSTDIKISLKKDGE